MEYLGGKVKRIGITPLERVNVNCAFPISPTQKGWKVLSFVDAAKQNQVRLGDAVWFKPWEKEVGRFGKDGTLFVG